MQSPHDSIALSASSLRQAICHAACAQHACPDQAWRLQGMRRSLGGSIERVSTGKAWWSKDTARLQQQLQEKDATIKDLQV